MVCACAHFNVVLSTCIIVQSVCFWWTHRHYVGESWNHEHVMIVVIITSPLLLLLLPLLSLGPLSFIWLSLHQLSRSSTDRPNDVRRINWTRYAVSWRSRGMHKSARFSTARFDTVWFWNRRSVLRNIVYSTDQIEIVSSFDGPWFHCNLTINFDAVDCRKIIFYYNRIARKTNYTRHGWFGFHPHCRSLEMSFSCRDNHPSAKWVSCTRRLFCSL